MPDLKQVEFDQNYVSHEQTIQAYWDSINLPDLLKNIPGNPFSFVDGPPFVSGALHLGHCSIFSEKDAVCKAFRMMGYDTSYKLGFDCHGLPIESKVCTTHNLTSDDVQSMGIEKFNALCDSMITSVSGSWEPLFKRIGRTADFQNTYMTRDLKFMESVLWCFKTLYDKGLVYQGNKVMPYSCALETPLSNFEAGQNYKDVSTKSVYVKFKAVTSPSSDNNVDLDLTQDRTYYIAWTTTPWTLVSNLALCINADLLYVLIEDLDSDDRYILCKSSIPNLVGKKRASSVKIIREFKGSELKGMRYIPVFQYMSDLNTKLGRSNDAYFKILSDPYVKDEGIGTGIVHQAPAFGEDDFRVCESYSMIDNRTVSDYCPITSKCCYTDIVKDYENMFVLDADSKICSDLKASHSILKVQDYTHSYPHCYRSDTPLIYRTIKSFFVKLEPLKERMIELNRTITWHPAEIGSNRFGKWLEGAKDWCLTRLRYYGTPIPVWINDENSEDMIVIGSIDELCNLAGLDRSSITNLHPEHLNSIKIIRAGKTYSRVLDIFDCWFESGAVPFGQIHYPFDEAASAILNNSNASSEYLCDFICEGLDQTRGWFYTLLVLSTAILDRAPFKTVVCTGLVLDENGNKLSKKLNNFEDPLSIIDEFGADIVRCYFIKSPLTKAEPLFFSKTAIGRLKSRFAPYINGFKFLIEHIIMFQNNNPDAYHRTAWGAYDLNSSNTNTNLMDAWILNRTADMAQHVTSSIRAFDLNRAIELLLDSFDDLTNWYIKLSRSRMKNNYGPTETQRSLQTLYAVLITYVQLWAPFTPFLSEYLFLEMAKIHHLDGVRGTKSVFVTGYPTFTDDENIKIDRSKLELMSDLQTVCQIVRSIRSVSSNHTSQVMPFNGCTISHTDEQYLSKLQAAIHIIEDEINVGQITFTKLENCIRYELKHNNQAIGQTFKKDAQLIRTALSTLDQFTLKYLYENRDMTFELKYADDTKTLNLSYPSDYFSINAVPIKTNSPYAVVNSNLKVEVDPTLSASHVYTYNIKMLKASVQSARKTMKLKQAHLVTVILDVLITNTASSVSDDLLTLLSKDTTTIVIGSFDDMTSDVSDENNKLKTSEHSIMYTDSFVWRTFGLSQFGPADTKSYFCVHHKF